MIKTARFDETQAFRYQLSRKWDEKAPTCAFVMLNPSTADETRDDRTVAKCIKYAQRWGFGGIEVLNLFAFRATNSSILKQRVDAGREIIGRLNTEITLTRCSEGIHSKIICAWGVKGELLGHGDRIARALRATVGRDLHCLKITKDGHPEHPLYLPNSLDLTPFPERGIRK